MSITLENKQGLIAGDGSLPVKMAQHAKENGFDVVAISLSADNYNLLKKYDLPTGNNLSKEQLFKYITLDKKRSGDYISIIRVEEIGKYEIKKILLNDIPKYL